MGKQGARYLYPESTIANVSVEGFLPDGRHYDAIVYVSGNFSTSYYAPASSADPGACVSDGVTDDKQFFVRRSCIRLVEG